MEIIKIRIEDSEGKPRAFFYRVSDVEQFKEGYEKVLEQFNFERGILNREEDKPKLMSLLKTSGFLDQYENPIFGEFDICWVTRNEYIDMIMYLIKKVSPPELVIERYVRSEFNFGGKGFLF
jgi:hypothetical protein